MTETHTAEPEQSTAAGGRAEPLVRRGPESFREFRFGPLLVLHSVARDPGDQLWGHTQPGERTRMRHLCSLHYLTVPGGGKVWGAYIGPLCLYWLWAA